MLIYHISNIQKPRLLLIIPFLGERRQEVFDFTIIEKMKNRKPDWSFFEISQLANHFTCSCPQLNDLLVTGAGWIATKKAK